MSKVILYYFDKAFSAHKLSFGASRKAMSTYKKILIINHIYTLPLTSSGAIKINY